MWIVKYRFIYLLSSFIHLLIHLTIEACLAKIIYFIRFRRGSCIFTLSSQYLTIWPDFTLIFQPTSHNRRSSVFLYPAIFEQNHFLWCGKLCPKLFILFCLKHGNFLFSWLFLYNRPKVFKWKRKFFNVFRRSIMSVKGFYPLCFVIVWI